MPSVREENRDRRYWTVRAICAFICRILARIEVVGQENLDIDGACLVVVNHLSVFDPPLLGILLPRRSWAMTAEKYRRHPLFSPIMHLVGVIFVQRGKVDRRALRAALKVLREDGVLVLAPEGTRSKTGGLQQAKEGAAYLASRTGATIVPVAITGTEKMVSALKRLRRERVRVVVGEPFRLPTASGLDRGSQLTTYTGLIMCRLATLLPESYRGFYRSRCTPEGAPLPAAD